MNWKHLTFFLFAFLYLLICNHHIFTTTLTGLRQPNNPYSEIENPQLTQYIQNKTGVKISTFYIVNSVDLFGGMTGIPTRPIMTISQGMYDSFSEEELQYVILHEVGHYTHFHSVKEIFLQMSILLILFFALQSFRRSHKAVLPLTVLLALFLGIACIQVARTFEWEADRYALERLHNPQAMISATKKLESAWAGPDDKSLIRILFYRSIPYAQRIQHAENFSRVL